MKRKRAEVTIGTDEIWVIRRSRGGIVVWCPQCGEQVEMLPPVEAAVLAQVSALSIYSQVESGMIHHRELPGGRVLVCSGSIARLATNSQG